MEVLKEVIIYKDKNTGEQKSFEKAYVLIMGYKIYITTIETGVVRKIFFDNIKKEE